jgi:phage host-nuclease inhibitor protein Gam
LDAIRTIEEVNKSYLLDHLEVARSLEHISVEQDEAFVIELIDLAMAFQKMKRKFKKVKI